MLHEMLYFETITNVAVAWSTEFFFSICQLTIENDMYFYYWQQNYVEHT